MSRSDRRIDRPLLPASCPVCGHVVLRADGVSREDGTRWGQVSGNRCHYRRLGGTAAALLPQPRRSCPLVVVPVTPSGPPAAVRTAGVRHTCRIAGRVSDTRAAQRPSAMAALGRRCPPWCPAAGRVDRWVDTPTRMVPAGRTFGAVGVHPPPPRRWVGRRRNLQRTPRTVPPPPSVVAVRDSGHRGQRAAARHGLRPGATATGTGRRGGGRWSDVANAGRRGRAGRSAGRGAGCGYRSSPVG